MSCAGKGCGCTQYCIHKTTYCEEENSQGPTIVRSHKAAPAFATWKKACRIRGEFAIPGDVHPRTCHLLTSLLTWCRSSQTTQPKDNRLQYVLVHSYSHLALLLLQSHFLRTGVHRFKWAIVDPTHPSQVAREGSWIIRVWLYLIGSLW